MTTTTTGNTTTTVIDELLAGFESGAGAALGRLYAPDAHIDLTTPGWRFHLDGTKVGYQWAEWFGVPGRFEELERHEWEGGAAVRYFLVVEEDGAPVAVHHHHTILVRDGLIVEERFFCGGRWNAARLAEMGAAGA
jgi:ketosteroid isomerase-like protein